MLQPSKNQTFTFKQPGGVTSHLADLQILPGGKMQQKGSPGGREGGQGLPRPLQVHVEDPEGELLLQCLGC